MCQVDPQAALAIEKTPIAPAQRWQRQHDHFGFAEGAVMAELARNWNFPDLVVSALAESFNPMSNEYPFHEISGATHVAGIMADAICLGLPSTTVTTYIGLDVLDALSLSQEKVVLNYCAHATISLE
jgi:HD-like signal output (HDOD) protein